MCILTVFLSDVVFLSDCESESDDAFGFWIRRLGLYQCDLLSLNPNMDLTENIVNAAQTLLKEQYDVDGCQNTSLAEYGKFIKVSPDKLSVQIVGFKSNTIFMSSNQSSPYRFTSLGMLGLHSRQ